MRPQTPLLILFILFLYSASAHAKSFDADGSDLLTGVGAEGIALSGAVTAGTSSIYSLYWNPAGLAELEENEISISGQTNAKIVPLNFAAVAFTTNWLSSFGLKSSIALSYIPRLHIKASGSYAENDLESVFIRFALPDLPGTFSGDIESKTKDNRISFAIMPEFDPKWSMGFSMARVDCETFFCGVTAKEPGKYIISSTKATAYTLNIGAKYYYNPNLTFAFNLKDVNTTLDIELKTVYEDGTIKHKTFQASFPKDLTIGTQWLYHPNLKLSLDYQILSGNYGKYKMNISTLRAGLEYSDQSLRYRFGLLAPLKLEVAKVSNVKDKLLFPVAPSIGIGWNNKTYSIDAALYTQIVMSAVRKKGVFGLDISLTSKF